MAQDLRADFGLNVCILHPTTWADIHAASKTAEIHGGKNETSMMLAAAPHLVRIDQIAKYCRGHPAWMPFVQRYSINP